MSLLRGLRWRLADHFRRPERRLHRLWVGATAFHGAVSMIEPEGGRVLVIAPHFDDEVLGCGGAIARHVACGATVTVVFVTDSRYVDANRHLPLHERMRLHVQLLAERKREALAAAARLQTHATIFLDGDPEEFERSPAVAARLAEILRRTRPEIVYVPTFLDRHPDHRAANTVLANAVAGESIDFECRAYEVWTPLMPNRLVAIDSTMDIKLAALACHASQLAHSDFAHMVRGLNAYRASATPMGGLRYAEAFFAAGLREYLALYADFSERAWPARSSMT